jgi:hypothetical protein
LDLRAAMDAATSAPLFRLTLLPLPLVLRIFLLLPVDSRGRACCVCRAWRDALADPELWTRLDLTEAGGVAAHLFADVPLLLQGAAGRAQGRLHTLDVRMAFGMPVVNQPALLAVLAANADSLRVLRVNTLRQLHGDTELASALAFFDAAPRLERLDADVACYAVDAPRFMRAEAPLGPLRIHSLEVRFNNNTNAPVLAAALADVALQPTLLSVKIRAAYITPQVSDALVDGLLARRVRKLELRGCTLPAAAPFARLLASGQLTTLILHHNLRPDMPFFGDEAGATLVADALRTNSSLTTLKLYDTHLSSDMHAACSLLGALVGHPSLRQLVLCGEFPEEGHRAALGAALAALVAADAPALHCMRISNINLGDAGMAPIINALVCNSHLLDLDASLIDLSQEFTRDQLLPAIRANMGLRKFACLGNPWAEVSYDPSIAEARELVADRTRRS